MRVLLVNDYVSPSGGVELYLDQVSRVLVARGHEVILFSSSAGSNGTSGTIPVEHCFGTTSPFRTLLQTANPWAARALGATISHFQPDVVHLNMFLTQLSPLILTSLRDLPCLYHAHWQRALCPTGTRLMPDQSLCRNRAGAVCYRGGCLPLRDWAPLMLQMRMLRGRWDAIDRIVAASKAMQTRFEEAGFADVSVLPYGVAEREARPPLSDPPTVAFAGRLVAEKGCDVLLRAFQIVARSVPSARLEIAGEGPDRPRLTRLAGELGLDHVVFLGWLSPEDLDRRLRDAWVQAVPSIWEEPFGLVAAEAAMRGTAVVSSNLGGLAEITIPDETGFLVPPRDVQALADALIRILSDRQLAETLGSKAREHAQSRYSMDGHTSRLIELYEQSIETRGP